MGKLFGQSKRTILTEIARRAADGWRDSLKEVRKQIDVEHRKANSEYHAKVNAIVGDLRPPAALLEFTAELNRLGVRYEVSKPRATYINSSALWTVTSAPSNFDVFNRDVAEAVMECKAAEARLEELRKEQSRLEYLIRRADASPISVLLEQLPDDLAPHVDAIVNALETVAGSLK